MYETVAREKAKAFGLNENLVLALIQVESAGDTWAVRFESHWKWFVNPANWAKIVRVSKSTEVICQQMSWGLMQVMGAVARELGFEEDLPKLCLPENGIHYGCKKIRHEINRWGTVEQALAAYNAGNPRSKAGQKYAQKVLNRMNHV